MYFLKEEGVSKHISRLINVSWHGYLPFCFFMSFLCRESRVINETLLQMTYSLSLHMITDVGNGHSGESHFILHWASQLESEKCTAISVPSFWVATWTLKDADLVPSTDSTIYLARVWSFSIRSSFWVTYLYTNEWVDVDCISTWCIIHHNSSYNDEGALLLCPRKFSPRSPAMHHSRSPLSKPKQARTTPG